MKSFADLGVSNAVVEALGHEGVTEPFAVQSLVISDILAGRDVLARYPPARARPWPSASRSRIGSSQTAPARRH